MARTKDRSEVEHLRGEIKNLRSQIRNLKKELARAQKRQFQYEDLEERSKEIEIQEKSLEFQEITTNRCPECGGTLQETDIGVRILVACDKCPYRITKKNG